MDFCCVQKNKGAKEILTADSDVLPAQLPLSGRIQQPRSSPFDPRNPQNAAVLQQHPHTHQAQSGGIVPGTASVGQSGNTALALVTAEQPDGQESPISSARSDADLTREEKEREKLRLQELVKKFTKDAVKGVACQKIELEDGLKRNATYALDRGLQTFSLEESETGEHRKWPIANIVDVYRSEESELVRSRKETSLTGLSREDLSRCVLLEYDNGRVGDPREYILLLEGSVRQKERFFTCMKVLRLYSMASPDDE